MVVGSDLIIYAAGSRDLPLRFTAFRKQEQIEGSSRMLSWLNEHARASMRFEQFKSCRSNPIPILCIPWLLKVLQILFFLNSSLTSLPVIISDMYNTSQLYTIFYTYKIDLFCIKLKKKKWLDFNLSWSNICSVCHKIGAKLCSTLTISCVAIISCAISFALRANICIWYYLPDAGAVNER